ncbi:MAG TPA: S8 family peptidase, partial [Acidimicrobiia bacterium]|nr:S8 family peptidase [Acidimicrobiia bacterium]
MSRSALRAAVAVVATVAASFVVVPAAGASRAGVAPARATRPRAEHTRYRGDRVLVKFKHGVTAQRRAQSLRGEPARTIAPAGDVQTVTVKNGDVMGEVARLKNDPAVEQVQPDFVRQATGVTPNASQWSQQWDMRKIDAPDAWSVSEGSSAPVVAVIDSGVDYAHPDLAGNMWNDAAGRDGCGPATHGYNFVAGNCLPLDDNGHGTHVSGTIGAAGGHVVGVNWRVQIMALKALDNNGDGFDSDLYNAIEWAVQAKTVDHVDVRAINASWGGGQDNPILDDAIRDAHTAGILFVAAAGNSGLDNDLIPDFPCASRYVLCVAASDTNDGLAVFSNYGRSTVALAAPGVDILSTWCDATVVGQPCDVHDYAYLDGTSMATPHVTGAAALVSEVTGLTGDQLRQRLVSSVDVVAGLVGRVASNGRLNLCRALAPNGCGAPVVKATQNGTGVTVQIQPVGTATSFHVTPLQPSGAPQLRGTNAFSPLGSYTVNQRYVFVVAAKNANGDGPATVVRVTPLKGGYLADGFGGIHAFADAGGVTPPPPNGGPYWGGWNIARGIAVLPSGAGGYVLDGWGGLHAFGVGSQAPPPPA